VLKGAALGAANNVVALSAKTHLKNNRIAMIERPELAQSGGPRTSALAPPLGPPAID
jgi:hypothetical protein